MGVRHSVRRTLLSLGAGLVAQRAMQLVAFVLIGRALGADGLGGYAQGLAAGAMLGVLAGAGIRNLAARAIVRQPAAAGAFVRRAVRARLANGLLLGALAAAAAFVWSDRPLFWALCILQVVPAAFDLRNLADAAGSARREVRLETLASLLHLLGVVWWRSTDGLDLRVLAAIALASRCLYASGAWAMLRALPRGDDAAALANCDRPRHHRAVALAQTAYEALAAGDVWLVAQCCGSGAAGFYAVGVRFAGAALMPSAQLARLLLPHLLHAANDGDARRTLGTAVRATQLATLPMLAGGAVLAPQLCALSGAGFAAAAPILVLLLAAGCCAHLGWQQSHALLAAGRDRAYAHGLGWPAVAQLLLLAALAPFADEAAPALFGTLAAAAAALAAGGYALVGHRQMLAHAGEHPAAQAWSPLHPALVAAATAGAAALPGWFVAGTAGTALQLLAGGGAFAATLWYFELRGRLRRVGDGLATASGFRA